MGRKKKPAIVLENGSTVQLLESDEGLKGMEAPVEKPQEDLVTDTTSDIIETEPEPVNVVELTAELEAELLAKAFNDKKFIESQGMLGEIVILKDLKEIHPLVATLKVKPIKGSGARLPEYQSKSASGMDLHVAHIKFPYEIAAGETVVLGTGLKLEIPEGFEGQVRTRSSMAARGLVITNSPGTIDSDYRGEVKLILTNLNLSGSIAIQPGERLGQLVITPVQQVHIEEVDELSDTERGEGGLGSTGRV